MAFKHYRVDGKKSIINAEYESNLAPALIDLEFNVKVIPDIKAIKQGFGDTNTFEIEWLRKNFTERGFASKLRSVNIPDFDIPFVTFSTQFDEKSIDLKNPKQIKFKIVVSIESQDDEKKYDIDEFKKIVDSAVKKIEPALLADNDYLKFSK